MKTSVFRAFALAAFLLALAAVSPAQINRTWVSGSGVDTNPCTEAEPCRTFTGALNKTMQNGEINCLTAGSFGPVTINKAVTIDCAKTQASILANAGGTAITISIPATTGFNTVRLRGLSLTGQHIAMHGIRILNAGKIIIEDLVIDDFLGNGIALVAGTFKPVQLFINNVTTSNISGGVGLNISAIASSKAKVSVTGSRFLSSDLGISAQNADVALSNCLIAGNDFAITAGAGGHVRMSGNTISENITPLRRFDNGIIASYGNNALTGNTLNTSPNQTLTLQ